MLRWTYFLIMITSISTIIFLFNKGLFVGLFAVGSAVMTLIVLTLEEEPIDKQEPIGGIGICPNGHRSFFYSKGDKKTCSKCGKPYKIMYREEHK